MPMPATTCRSCAGLRGSGLGVRVGRHSNAAWTLNVGNGLPTYFSATNAGARRARRFPLLLAPLSLFPIHLDQRTDRVGGLPDDFRNRPGGVHPETLAFRRLEPGRDFFRQVGISVCGGVPTFL